MRQTSQVAATVLKKGTGMFDDIEEHLGKFGRKVKSVMVVFDMESSDAPFPIGVYLNSDEDGVLYTRSDGKVAFAPQDSVTVKQVDFDG